MFWIHEVVKILVSWNNLTDEDYTVMTSIHHWCLLSFLVAMIKHLTKGIVGEKRLVLAHILQVSVIARKISYVRKVLVAGTGNWLITESKWGVWGGLWKLEAYPQWPTSCSEALPKGLQLVQATPAGNQVFKYLSPWGSFHMQTTISSLIHCTLKNVMRHWSNGCFTEELNSIASTHMPAHNCW